MRTFIILLSLLATLFSQAQQPFPYQQTWGSYVGPKGTHLIHQFYTGTALFINPNGNIFLNSVVYKMGTTLPELYYNQFVHGNGSTIGSGYSQNIVDYGASFDPLGQQTTGGYRTAVVNGTVQQRRLIFIDSQGAQYFVEEKNMVQAGLATAGAWLDQIPNPNTNRTITLAKYSSAGALVYRTYLPNNESSNFLLREGENGDIFLLGSTNRNIALLATAGAFQENYIGPTNTTYTNAYLVKLSSSGQRIWGTYMEAGIANFIFFNGGIYLIAHHDNPLTGNYTTPGTFQPDISAPYIIMKLNAGNGSKQWGTYYGAQQQTFNGEITSLQADESGLYVSGYTYDEGDHSYYGTTGAYQPQLQGSSDMILSKFDLNGQRLWSTYYGSMGQEFSLSDESLAVHGDLVVLAGNQNGNSYNISTPGAFLEQASNPFLTNMFFAGFDATTGQRKWCSYFGGPSAGSYGEYISPHFLDNGALLLYGTTTAASGIATANGQYPVMINPQAPDTFGYITRFDLKNLIGTDEVQNLIKDLQLFDNPNNGNFSLRGNLLEKQNCILKITDAAGRLILMKKLSKNKLQTFQHANMLTAGSYLVEVQSQNCETLKVFKMIVKK